MRYTLCKIEGGFDALRESDDYGLPPMTLGFHLRTMSLA